MSVSEDFHRLYAHVNDVMAILYNDSGRSIRQGRTFCASNDFWDITKRLSPLRFASQTVVNLGSEFWYVEAT